MATTPTHLRTVTDRAPDAPATAPTTAAPLSPVPLPTLRVGAADDRAEVEADRRADDVLARLRGAQEQHAHGPGCDHDGAVRRAPAAATGQIGLAGGDLDAATDARITDRLGRGQVLDAGVRRDMEGAFGRSFSSVRVHRDAEADQLNRQLSSTAFTVGRDVFFRGGTYRPGDEGGQRLLAHELAHVEQHAAGAHRTVHRDIGFELESREMKSRRTNGPAIAANSYATPGDAATAFAGGVPVAKGAALLTRGKVEVQADEVGRDSDIEIVIDHVTEDATGRTELDTAMTDLTDLLTEFDRVAQGGIASASSIAGTGHFTLSMADGLIKADGGSFLGARTSPQVTMGLRLKNVGTIVEDLHGSRDHAPGSAEEVARRPGQQMMRADDPSDATRPKPLRAGNEADTLVTGHDLAKKAVAAYHAIDNASPNDAGVVGFLTIIFAYTEGVRYKNSSFMKSHTPLMAKTDLLTMWKTLPQTTQDYYAQTSGGRSRFERMMMTQPGYSKTRMKAPLFDGKRFIDQSKVLGPKDKIPTKEWYHKLILQDWVRSIVVSPQPSLATAAWRCLFGGPAPTDRRVDKLTNTAFPGRPTSDTGYRTGGTEVEGYGALGARMDADVTTGEALPVFELRSATRLFPLRDAHDWVMEMFDYIASVNASPDTGGTKIT